MHLVPDTFGVELLEFNPCHAPKGTPMGGKFCSDKIPGRSERLIKEAQARIDTNEDESRTPWGDTTLSAKDKTTIDTLLQHALAKETVKVRVPSEVLTSIVRDGRLRNQYETGVSNGYIEEANLDKEDYHRRQVEKHVFGIEPDFPGKDRPIYGYVTTGFSEGSVSSYGDMELVLNDTVRARTTVTMGDSFGLAYGRYSGSDHEKTHQLGMGMPLNNPGWQMLHPNSRRDLAHYADTLLHVGEMSTGVVTGNSIARLLKQPYIEAQITGGVKLSDIKEIKFHDDGGPDAGLDLHRLGFTYSKKSESWVRK